MKEVSRVEKMFGYFDSRYLFVDCVLLPIFDVYQTRSAIGAEINPLVNSLRSPSDDQSFRQTEFSRGAHDILFAPFVRFFERFSLTPYFSTMPRRRRDAMRFGINYSGGRRPHVGGRGPIFRSTACAISIACTPREAASMLPQCGLDLRNWLPIRRPLWHFVSP